MFIQAILRRDSPWPRFTISTREKIANWKDVGGPNLAIVKIGRDTNSGTYETFETIVLRKDPVAADAETAGSNGAIRQRVQATPAAIGYVGLAFADKTVKALKVDDVAPSAETVASGVYPIARPLFLYTNGYPKLGSPLHRFVSLYLLPEGQEMIEKIGFVPLTKY